MNDYLKQRYKEFSDDGILEQLQSISDTDAMVDLVKSIVHNEDNLGRREHRRTVKKLFAAVITDEPDVKKIMHHDNVYTFLQSTEPNVILNVLDSMNIKLPPKARKRGKSHLIHRIMLKFYRNERMQNALSAFLETNVYHVFPILRNTDVRADEFLESIAQLCHKHNRSLEDMLITTCFMISSTPLEDRIIQIMRTFKAASWEEFERRYILSYMMYKMYAFQEQMQESETIDVERVMKEKERLENTLKKQAKQHAHLKSELHQRNMKEKELKGKIHDLNKQLQTQLDDALNEIHRLELQLTEQKESYEKEITQLTDQYTEELYKLRNRIRILEATSHQSDKAYLPLQGLNVCVVGHPKKKNDYKEIVEKYGGSFEFYSSSPDGSSVLGLEGPVCRADLVFYLTTYTNHTVTNKLKSLIPLSKITFLHAGGVNYFEDKLLTAVQDQTQIAQ